MRRSELYKKLLESIIDKLFEKGLITTSDDADQLKDDVDFNMPLEERAWFDDIADLDIYGNFIKVFKGYDASLDDPEIAAPNYTKIASANNEQKCELKSFCINDTVSNIAVITGLKIREFATCTACTLDSSIIPVLELFLIDKIDDEQEINDFLALCEDPNSEKYIISSSFEIEDENAWNIYSYAYLYHINTSKFDIPSPLKFEADTPFHTSLQFDSDTEYCQYYDIMHVLHESKHCDDMLRRFLHIYQVIEDLCYRRLIVKIANANLRKTGFVRHSIRIINGIRNEEDAIIKGINELFPELHTDISAADITPHNIFLDTNFPIKSGEPHSVTKLAKIIYQLRNCIVHNKHTEFHFTYGNIADYETIIPLIEKFIQVLEKSVIDILNKHENKKIDYPHPHIRVY